MRTFLLCALAIALVGCSRQPTSSSCVGLNPLACLTAVHVPLEPEAQNSDSTATEQVSAIAWRGEKPPRSHADHAVRRTSEPIKVATKTRAATPAAHRSSQTNQQTTGNASASEAARASATEPNATTGSVTATDASPDALVVVLLVSSDIKSVADLAGKTIAIDDRYSEQIKIVRTAMAAAGAREVQFSKGENTAINRLASNEVPAAVLALVSVDAAESVPELTQFRAFRIPLSPRSSPAKR